MCTWSWFLGGAHHPGLAESHAGELSRRAAEQGSRVCRKDWQRWLPSHNQAAEGQRRQGDTVAGRKHTHPKHGLDQKNGTPPPSHGPRPAGPRKQEGLHPEFFPSILERTRSRTLDSGKPARPAKGPVKLTGGTEPEPDWTFNVLLDGGTWGSQGRPDLLKTKQRKCVFLAHPQCSVN